MAYINEYSPWQASQSRRLRQQGRTPTYGDTGGAAQASFLNQMLNQPNRFQNPYGTTDQYGITTRGGVSTPGTQMNVLPEVTPTVRPRRSVVGEPIVYNRSAESRYGRDLADPDQYANLILDGALPAVARRNDLRPETISRFADRRNQRKEEMAKRRQRQLVRAQVRDAMGANYRGTPTLVRTDRGVGTPPAFALQTGTNPYYMAALDRANRINNAQELFGEMAGQQREDRLRQQHFENIMDLAESMVDIDATRQRTRESKARTRAARNATGEDPRKAFIESAGFTALAASNPEAAEQIMMEYANDVRAAAAARGRGGGRRGRGAVAGAALEPLPEAPTPTLGEVEPLDEEGRVRPEYIEQQTEKAIARGEDPVQALQEEGIAPRDLRRYQEQKESGLLGDLASVLFTMPGGGDAERERIAREQANVDAVRAAQGLPPSSTPVGMVPTIPEAVGATSFFPRARAGMRMAGAIADYLGPELNAFDTAASVAREGRRRAGNVGRGLYEAAGAVVPQMEGIEAALPPAMRALLDRPFNMRVNANRAGGFGAF